MRPYVESVYSNLKSPLPGGEAWKIDLSQRTLFVGSNTSHKSGVIQSIELALAGSADDIFGEGSKVKRPTHDGPGPATLVHRSVASALSGSPASARKAFLAWSGNNIDQDSIVAYLPESLQGKYKDIAEHKGRGKSSVETLIGSEGCRDYT